MVPAVEPRTAKLCYLQPPPLGAVVHGEMVEHDHAVRQAVELHVSLRRRLVVEEQDRALPGRKELLEREDLPAKPQRIARE